MLEVQRILQNQHLNVKHNISRR